MTLNTGQRVIVPTVYGVKQSPFVRKVRAFLYAKGRKYNSISVMPGDSRATFRKISPFGKVPGYREGSLKLCDSSVICAYLERSTPQPALFPLDPKEMAHALWIEEYCDTFVARMLTFRLLYQCFIKPAFQHRKPDEELVKQTLEEEVPPIFDYLEGIVKGEQYLVNDELSIGDIALMSHLVSYEYSGHEIDASQWKKLSNYYLFMRKTPLFAKVLTEENAPFISMFRDFDWLGLE